MATLKRLTAAIVKRAERGGQTAGWYKLCREGYLPDEIAIHTDSTAHRNDIRSRVFEYAKRHDLPLPATCAPKRAYVRKAADITDPKAAFRATAMKTGLALVLTQPMLEYLCAKADNVRWDRAFYWQENGVARPDSHIQTAAALQKRGLLDYDRKLTTIGHKVVDVLREAGVFIEADEAIRKKGGA